MSNIYEVAVGTGLAWPLVKMVEAFTEQDAVDAVADELVKDGYAFVRSYFDIEKECEEGESVEQYAKAHNLVCCGNTGVYLEVVNIEKTGEI